jgi:hypothetical protein
MSEEKKGPLSDKTVYVIGSLKNREEILPLTKQLRDLGFKEIFDDWISPGPEADDFWRDYEREIGSGYSEALKKWSGKHVFEFDSFHIERCDIGIMCEPCGKSGRLEFGQIMGSGKKGYIFSSKESEELKKEEYKIADGIFHDIASLKQELITNTGEPTLRKGFQNIFILYHTKKSQGYSDKNVKNYLKKRIKEMWASLDKKEKKKFVSLYTAAREILGGFKDDKVYKSDTARKVMIPEVMYLPRKEKTKKVDHLNFGFALGSGRRSYLLFDGEPERWDVMYQYADGIHFNEKDLGEELSIKGTKPTDRNNFSNILIWFHSARMTGKSIHKSKKYAKLRVEKMMNEYRGYEKKLLKHKYDSAMGLLK